MSSRASRIALSSWLIVLSFVSPVTGRINAVLATSQTADRNDQTVGQSTGEPGKTESRLKLLDELAEAEATWVAQKPHAYQFTFRFACNGLIATPPPGYGLWLFEVNGEATRFAGVRPDMADYATVERQFAFIRKAWSGGHFAWTFDMTLGAAIQRGSA
jgi:hypothetical protein